MKQDLTILVYIFLRSFSLCCFLPINYKNNGILQKGLLAIILSVLSWLYIPLVPVNLSFISLFLEIVFGSIIAIPYLLAVEATLFVADFLDISRGQQLVGVQDPHSLDIVSNLGLLMKNTLVVILIIMNVAISGLELFLKLFSFFPVGSFTFNQLINYSPQLIEEIVSFLSGIVCFVLLFSFLFFLIDWGCAFIAKYLPTFHPAQDGFVFKSLVLFLVLLNLLNESDLIISLVHLIKQFPFIEEVL